MDEKLNQLTEIGQSLWLDDLRRSYLVTGKLGRLIEVGLRGETSNPTIFDKAIGGSGQYDQQLQELTDREMSPQEIFEHLAIQDIQDAADLFLPVYEKLDGRDGFISVEVNPHLARDTEATIDGARRLLRETSRPNVLVKVPGTEEGIPAIRALISEGRNINITLMFSLSQYEAVAEAYISGLEQFAAKGGDISQVASVASFFVSRIDVKIDEQLDALEESALRGRIGIANAKMAYQRFKDVFCGPRWDHLAEQGARPQRVLWASTSVKDPAYPDTMYGDALIGPYTVNTMPLRTIEAFLDHGTIRPTLESRMDEAHRQLQQLAELGISLDEITNQLVEEGVQKFSKSFDDLLDTIDGKTSHFRKHAGQSEVVNVGKEK